MNISTINSFFKKLGEAQIKHRWLILGAFIMVTLVCCAGLSKFRIVNGSEGWYGEGDKLQQDKNRYETAFGNMDSAAVLLVADDVFTEEILTVIDRLGQRMLNEIPFADKITSLTEVEIPLGNEEGFEVIKPYANGIPSDPVELKAKRDFVLRGTEKTSAYINTLVSEDGKETWITLSLLPYENPDDDSLEVGYAFTEILNSDEFKSDSYKLYGCGQAYMDVQEEIYEYPDSVLRILLGFIVMLVFLAVAVRSVSGVIIPSLATIGAIASVLGGMAWFGVKADLALITLPILLGMALSVGYSIHYINMFKLYFRRTGNRKLSAVKTVEESGWSVFFTVLTTVASLVSFIFVNMKPISWMGKTSSLVVLAVFVYVSILIPIFMSFGKSVEPAKDNTDKKGATKVDMCFAHWADVVKNKRWGIIGVSALIIGVCIPLFFKIDVKVDVIGMTGTKLPHMQQLTELLTKKLGNHYSYSVMISFEDEGAFKNPENMGALEEFQQFLGTLSLTKISGGKPRVMSVTSLLCEMNRALNEGDEAYYTVPDDEYVLAQLLELSSIEMAKDFGDVMDDEFRTVTVDVDMTKFESEEAVKNIALINQKLSELFPNAECCILGDMIEYAEMSTRMVRGELKSFCFSFVVVAIMLIIAFTSLRTGIISMIPNVAPVILIGGFMGAFGYQLDFVTMTVMPLILGIAVDDTIHLTTHLKYGLEKYGSYQESMEASFREIGKSMFMTTFILCSIFAVYLFSPLRYLSLIGILSILGLAGALAADYTITPALLYIVKPFGKEIKGDDNE